MNFPVAAGSSTYQIFDNLNNMEQADLQRQVNAGNGPGSGFKDVDDAGGLLEIARIQFMRGDVYSVDYNFDYQQDYAGVYGSDNAQFSDGDIPDDLDDIDAYANASH